MDNKEVISYTKVSSVVSAKETSVISHANKPGNAKMKSSECDSAVLVKNLCKSFGKRDPPVLNNFNMNVRKGTIYGLLGSSGCGKTTALSCIVGLKKWESGDIYVFGKWWAKESEIPGNRLGYVPQDIALYDQLSIKENIQFYGRLYGMDECAILERWQFLVHLLQLPIEFKMVMNLSGGQRRRTSLAIALVHSPELLILDEPTVGLDPLLRESVWHHLYQMVQNLGTTIIITTHYIEEARYSDTIGVMRHGSLLVEDSPTALMEKHKTDLLEDVVLNLCWEATKLRNRRKRSSKILNNNKSQDEENPEGLKGTTNHAVRGDSYLLAKQVPSKTRRSSTRSTTSCREEENISVTFQSKWKTDLESVVTENTSVPGKYTKYPEFDSSPKSTSVNIGSQKKNTRSAFSSKESRVKKWISNVLSTSQRIKAFCCIIYLCLLRHPIFFLAALVLPAVEVLLTISSIGKAPKGLAIGVINDEIPDWITKCSFGVPFGGEESLNMSLMNAVDSITDKCDFNELSCKYLRLVSSEDFLHLVPYKTTEDAESAIHRGDLWGYVHFSSNYSQHMIDRLATKMFAFEETIKGSTISVKLDMSQYLGSVLIIKQLFDGMEEYVRQLIDSCELGAQQAEYPLKYRPPVFGSLGPDYHNYIIPGVLANIMFMMPFAISAIMFITDLKSGTLGRSRVAGLRTFELMLTYAITQGSIVVGQIIICTTCLKLGFNFQIVGSTFLYIAITFLLGMCGQAFGLWIGIISKDEIEALITALFILPLMLMFGGVIWPVEAMAAPWKYIGLSLPTTMITESLRSTATRGVGLTHGLMWPGLLVTTGWGIVFWIACIVSYRICIK